MALRRVLEDVWADPLVLRRWQRLATGLTEAQCEQVVREAMRRGLAGPQVRWLPRELATEGWALESRGYVQPARDARAAQQPLALPPERAATNDEHAHPTAALAA
jgi:hypothetical protein